MTGKREVYKGLALVPGLLFAALFFTACEKGVNPAAENRDLCLAEVTPISTIQGNHWESPLRDNYQLTSGVVTHVDPESGYFIEHGGNSQAPDASRALFVEAHDATGNIEPGQRVAVGGRVVERGSRRDTMTTLADVDRFTVCGSGLPLPLTRAALPLSSVQRESFEGMRLEFRQELHVSDVYSNYRGKLMLSARSALRVPTEDMPPGEVADSQARDNRALSINVYNAAFESSPIAAGSRIEKAAGVMGHDGREQWLLLSSHEWVAEKSPDPVTAAPSGSLRVVNANLLNYFNGDGRGGGFPNERGAETRRELERQEQRIRAAMGQIRPDLLAVQELENDGFAANSAAQSLVALLNDSGNGDYAVVRAPGDRLGSDVITVGLFYRKQALEAVGPSHTLDAAPFRGLSRQPLAQVFRDRASGKTFLIAANHLKSKGSCPESGPNTRQNDGQGCWNRARLESVQALAPWLEQLAREAGTQRILVFGDMNAYRMEDPVRAFRAAGYTELVESLSGLPQYSYRFFGQAGTLDYAFASPALAGIARQARIWHINSDWPQEMDLPEPWLRMSDHDPVIVDLDFGHNP
ncbi:MAG: ExeM/NucH family extracellular endonuclease [Xanthomonadales bacterium]|nr:ExeM/NucH family extracellular endonuclease [Xanthomonadales bacterium]